MGQRMSGNLPKRGLQLQSTLDSDGGLLVCLQDVDIAHPGPGEVLIRIEAAPINPSDLMTMFPAADPAQAQVSGSADDPGLRFQLS